MKRTLLLMLALLLPALAAADVSAQVNAPETYSAVWKSSTGRTIVTVDAAVEIPAVPQLMIYPAVQRMFTADDLQRAAVCFGAAPYSGMPSSLDSVPRPAANSNPTSVGIRAESKNAAGNRALLTFVQHRRHDGNYGTTQSNSWGTARHAIRWTTFRQPGKSAPIPAKRRCKSPRALTRRWRSPTRGAAWATSTTAG